MPYSQRFEDALLYAARVHKDQTRKGGNTPYINHLMAVAALVGENGGSEDEVIAALLHDAPEDQGGLERLREIGQLFGPKVEAIVSACSDTFEEPKPPWRPRKEAYIEHLRHGEVSSLLVSAADKLHNARSILADLGDYGVCTFDKFSGRQSGTLWYYAAVADVLEQRAKTAAHPGLARLVRELRRVVEEIDHACEERPSAS